MNVLFKGQSEPLEKEMLQIGDLMPDFTVVNQNLEKISSHDMKGLKLYLSVPSIDTSVCSMEVAKFMTYLRNVDVTCYSISKDLPFALSRWCMDKTSNNVIAVSDYFDGSFGHATGVVMPNYNLLARAVFLVDEQNIIRYMQVVDNVSNEPDYDGVLKAIKAYL